MLSSDLSLYKSLRGPLQCIWLWARLPPLSLLSSLCPLCSLPRMWENKVKEKKLQEMPLLFSLMTSPAALSMGELVVWEELRSVEILPGCQFKLAQPRSGDSRAFFVCIWPILTVLVKTKMTLVVVFLFFRPMALLQFKNICSSCLTQWKSKVQYKMNGFLPNFCFSMRSLAPFVYIFDPFYSPFYILNMKIVVCGKYPET